MNPTENVSKSVCPDCDKQLNRALWSKDYNYKSCPHCSVTAGEHVFYGLDKFLNREEGRGAESWCRGCAWYGKDKGGGISVFAPVNIECSSGIPHNKVPRDKKNLTGKELPEQEDPIWTKLINESATNVVYNNAAFYSQYARFDSQGPQLGDDVKHFTNGDGMVVKINNKDGRKQIGIIFSAELIKVLKEETANRSLNLA